MNCFDYVEERYMLNIRRKKPEDVERLLSVKTNLYKEIQGDWLIFYMEDDSDFQFLKEDIPAVRAALYRIKYEEQNCSNKGFFD